jgi:ActR/RegA family two-component response regulator
MGEQAPSVLLVDDEEAICRICGEALTQLGYRVVTAADGVTALQLAAQETFAAAVVDLVLPDIDGLSILAALREADPDMIVIIMTGHATLESAIEAVRRGAYDFLRKPFGVQDLARVLERGLSQRELSVRNRHLVSELDEINRDLHQRVQVVTEELTAFINLGRRLGEADGPLPILADLIRAARQLTNATTGAIFATEFGGAHRCLLAEGEAAGELQGAEFAPHEPLLNRCLQLDHPLLVPQLFATDGPSPDGLALLGFSEALLLPLAGVAGTVGVLGLFDPTAPFTERQANLVKVLAAQAAEVVVQARLRGVARAASDTDADEFVELQDLLEGP